MNNIVLLIFDGIHLKIIEIYFVCAPHSYSSIFFFVCFPANTGDLSGVDLRENATILI